MTWLPPVKWCTVHVCLHTEDVNMTLNIADQYRRRIHTLLIMSAVVLISLLLPSVVAQVDSGVTLETVDMNWHQWPLFHSDHELTELLIPHPSGILLSEHSINGTAIRVGRLGHSAVSIRQEWSDIHGTNGPVLDRESCEDVITRTEEYVAVHGWTTHRHAQYPTTGLIFKWPDYMT